MIQQPRGDIHVYLLLLAATADTSASTTHVLYFALGHLPAADRRPQTTSAILAHGAFSVRVPSNFCRFPAVSAAVKLAASTHAPPRLRLPWLFRERSSIRSRHGHSCAPPAAPVLTPQSELLRAPDAILSSERAACRPRCPKDVTWVHRPRPERCRRGVASS